MIFALFKNNILQYWDTYEKNKNQNNEETAIEKKKHGSTRTNDKIKIIWCWFLEKKL